MMLLKRNVSLNVKNLKKILLRREANKGTGIKKTEDGD